jgi:enoyl-CoA hydratase/carnithine racemase
MMSDVIVSRDGPANVLRLNRPAKKNALTNSMYAALSNALDQGERSPEVLVHIIVGQPGIFCAGNDIGDFLNTAIGAAGLGPDVLRFIRLLPRLTKPLIAGVDGAAIGIGTTLLLHCDLVYATARASFAAPFADLGLVPEAASSLLLPQRIGYARAFEMMCLGNTMSAERAREAGLINDIVDADKLDTVCMAAARTLAAKPVAALLAARTLMRGDPAAVCERTEAEAILFAKMLATDEAKAAFEAFFSRSRR